MVTANHAQGDMEASLKQLPLLALFLLTLMEAN